MNKISKLLARLALKDRQRIIETVEIILSRDWSGLDIKKLAGFDEWRVRVGDFRIKFKEQEKKIIILAVERRGDHT